MNGEVLFRISGGQLQAFEEAIEAAKSDIEDAWKSERQKAAVAGNLRGMVRLCLDIPQTLRNLGNSTLDLIAARLIDDYVQTGQKLHQSFTQGLHILSRIQELVQSFERMGGAVAGAAALEEAITEVRRLEAAVLDHWPDFSEEDLTKARTESEKGVCLDMATAFAQTAGVARETWLRRVEERQRTKQS